MPPIPRRSLIEAATGPDPVRLDWLEDGGPGAAPGSTVGVPWPRGAYRPERTFALTDADGEAVPVRSWPLAHRPDGSLERTAHAVSSDASGLTLTAGNGRLVLVRRPETESEDQRAEKHEPAERR